MADKKDNIHPVVRLLAARVESHPDEFDFEQGPDQSLYESRWGLVLERIKGWASEEDMAVLRKPFMDAIHRDTMDELLNGPERRAEEERLREEERKQWAAQAFVAQAQTLPMGAHAAQALAAHRQTMSPGQQYAQAQSQSTLRGLQIQHDLANQNYRVSNGTMATDIPEEALEESGKGSRLWQVLDQLVKTGKSK